MSLNCPICRSNRIIAKDLAKKTCTFVGTVGGGFKLALQTLALALERGPAAVVHQAQQAEGTGPPVAQHQGGDGAAQALVVGAQLAAQVEAIAVGQAHRGRHVGITRVSPQSP